MIRRFCDLNVGDFFRMKDEKDIFLKTEDLTLDGVSVTINSVALTNNESWTLERGRGYHFDPADLMEVVE